MSMTSLRTAVSEINAEKVFATSHATSGTTYVFDLSAVNDPVSGGKLCGADGRQQPLLVLQCDQDFAYKFSTSSSDTVTLGTGIFVKANDQEYVRPIAQTGRFYLCVIQSTAAGTCKIFKSAASK